MSTNPPDPWQHQKMPPSAPPEPSHEPSQPPTASRSALDLNVFSGDPPIDAARRGSRGLGRWWWVRLIVALALVTAASILFVARSGTDNGGTVGVPLTFATTTTSTETTTTAAIATTTTVGTTTVPTTTAPTATRTSPPFIEPLGNPVDVEQLVLGASGIGDLTLGDPAAAILGQLSSSLGQPTVGEGPMESTGELGTCPGDRITVYGWGPLEIVTRTTSDGSEIFYNYRLDGRSRDSDAPAAAMRTLSGLALGDTVARVRNIYSPVFTVELNDHTVEGPTFEVRGERVLLWGPVTSTDDDGTVEGIFAIDPCGEPLLP